MHSAISYYAENVTFSLKRKRIISSWINEVVNLQMRKVKTISFIFCDDNYLYELNRKYLKHNTLTDIITFDYSEQTNISGDIFISIERITENSKKFNNSFKTELYRVMCHGILHLTGVSDKTKSARLEMRMKEDKYLSILREKYLKVSRETQT